MKPLLSLALGIACGAAAMYFLDPSAGRRRRAYVRDKTVATRRDAVAYANARTRYAAGQARGVVAGLRAYLKDDDTDDVRLAERVRAALGRLVSRPRMVDVSVDHGQVRLSGQVPDAERQAAIKGIACVRGVRTVVDDCRSTPAATESAMRTGGDGSAP
ncbi:BON domain-containing protein [Burkholderia stagnalis]|uniref:BON domain-containing protein n=1 Tax=Burkholderia stagnalis TaxID=1503054 RepID=UPI000A719519